jgi:tetratricopeptide (TPR) repeat protein
MGDLLRRVDDLAGARASYEKALPIYREIEARLGEANVLASLGLLALAEGNEVEADRLLETATAINQAIGERFNPALDSAKYGLALREIGKKEKARLYLLRAAESFAAIGFDDYAETCRVAAEDSDEEEN